MDVQKETMRESLLVRLLDVLSPDNATITQIKEDEAQAKADIESIGNEDPKLTEEINDCNEILTLLLGYKDSHTKLGETSVNLIDRVNRLFEGLLTYDFNKYAQESKEAYDKYEEKLAHAKDKKEQNAKRLAEANEIVSETPKKLKDEQDKIEPLNSEINKIFSGEVKYLNSERIDELLRKLDVFTEEEIALIVPAICFPDEFDFRSIYVNYNSEDKDAKKSIGSIISEANEKAALEEPMKDATKVTAVSPIKEEKEEKKPQKKEVKKVEVKEEPKEDLRNAYLEEVFGITAADIEAHGGLDASLEELKEYSEKLIAADINPMVVRVQTLNKRSIDNLIRNKEIFAEMGYPLDEMTISKNIGILDKVSGTTVAKDIAIINTSGLSLYKPSGKVAVVAVTKEPNKLRNAIKLASSIDISYFTENPEKMGSFVSEPMAHILYCQQNHINYKNAYGEFETFIENNKEWKEMYGEVGDISILPKTRDCNEALKDELPDAEFEGLIKANGIDYYISDAEVEDSQLERYHEIMEILQEINTSENSLVIEVEGNKFLSAVVNKNIISLLNGNYAINNEEILLGALVFGSHVPASAIKDIKVALNPNTRGMKIANK